MKRLQKSHLKKEANRSGYTISGKIDITRPYVILSVFLLLFLILGFQGLTANSAILYFVFVISFIAGTYIAANRRSANEHEWVWKSGIYLLLIGVISAIANFILIGTVPLLEPGLKSTQFPPLTMLSFLTVPGGIILFGNNIRKGHYHTAFTWLTLSLFIISLTAFKTQIFALLLSSAFLFYRLYERKNVMNIAALLLGILLFSYFLFVDFGIRAAATVGIFSSMANDITVFGTSGGTLTQSIFSSMEIIPGPNKGPRGLISDISGVEGVTTTPTIIGIPYFDFGLFGIIIFGFILGYLLQIGANSTGGIVPIHYLNLSLVLMSIETGIGDIIVIFYLIVYGVMLWWK